MKPMIKFIKNDRLHRGVTHSFTWSLLTGSSSINIGYNTVCKSSSVHLTVKVHYNTPLG